MVLGIEKGETLEKGEPMRFDPVSPEVDSAIG